MRFFYHQKQRSVKLNKVMEGRWKIKTPLDHLSVKEQQTDMYCTAGYARSFTLPYWFYGMLLLLLLFHERKLFVYLFVLFINVVALNLLSQIRCLKYQRRNLQLFSGPEDFWNIKVYATLGINRDMFNQIQIFLTIVLLFLFELKNHHVTCYSYQIIFQFVSKLGGSAQ